MKGVYSYPQYTQLSLILLFFFFNLYIHPEEINFTFCLLGIRNYSNYILPNYFEEYLFIQSGSTDIKKTTNIYIDS